MPSTSGVTFVSFCFISVFLLSLKKPRRFVQSFFVLRYACAPTPPTAITRKHIVSLYIYICTITVFSLNGEYVVRPPLLDGVFLPCDRGLWVFDISLLSIM